MQVEYYEPTRRDKLRAAAFRETPGGKASAQRARDAWEKVVEWRRKHGMPVPSESSEKEDAPR